MHRDLQSPLTCNIFYYFDKYVSRAYDAVCKTGASPSSLCSFTYERRETNINTITEQNDSAIRKTQSDMAMMEGGDVISDEVVRVSSLRM